MQVFNRIKAAKVEKEKNENLMVVIKYLENLEESEAEVVRRSLPKEGFLTNDIVDYFFKEAKKSEYILMEKNKVNQMEYSIQNKYFEEETPMSILDTAISTNNEKAMTENFERVADERNEYFK